MSKKTKRRYARRKILSMILSAALILTMTPVSASQAAEGDVVVEVTNFTDDTTFVKDTGDWSNNKSWLLILHDPEYKTTMLSEEDQNRITEGLDKTGYKLKSFAFTIHVEGTVAQAFTPGINMLGSNWSIKESGSLWNCTLDVPTISQAGDYEVVVTLKDDAIVEDTTAKFLENTIVIATQESDSVANNPGVTLSLTKFSVTKTPISDGSDLTALEGKIAEADVLLEDYSVMVGKESRLNYTRSTYNELNQAWSDAKYHIKKTNTQEEVDAATTRLENAINNLVSTKALNNALLAYLELKEADYTKDSWSVLTTNVANAQNVADDADAETVAALTKGVTDAIDGLVVIQYDLKQLQSLVKEETDSRLEEDYVPEDWAAYQTAYNNAKAVLDNPSADLTQEDVDALYDELMQARQMKPADSSAIMKEVDALVEEARGYQKEDYTAASWSVFETALQAAENADGPRVSAAKKLLSDLQNAIEGLQKREKSDIYAEFTGSWIKTDKSHQMLQGKDANDPNVKLDINEWWMCLSGLDLSGMVNPTLAVEYKANGDTLQITYNTTGDAGWQDSNEVITQNKENSGNYTCVLDGETKCIVLTSNADKLEYTNIKVFDDVASAVTEYRNKITDAMNEIAGLKQADYTAESWKALETAVEAAGKLTDTSSLEEIMAAQKALESAMDALKKADTTKEPNSTNQNGTSQKNNNQTKTLAKGTVFTAGKLKYKVTNKTSVAVKAPKSKKTTSVTIPATVKKNGVTYKVTSIAANAFKNCKKLKKVTVGKNVTSIGKNAFTNAKSLKKITVKSTKIKTVGKNALKGIHKKAVIKVPKAKLKKYKKIFKKKGQKKSVKLG